MRRGLGVTLLLAMASVAMANEPIKIPFVDGLTIVRAISTPEAEYESIRSIDSVSEKSYFVRTAAEVPDASGRVSELQVRREVSAVDQREARKMRLYFHTDDPEDFPGTTPGISRAVLQDLRSKGVAELTFLDVGPGFIGGSVIKRTMRGSVTRAGFIDVSMLVNGKRVTLKGLRAQGRVADASGSEGLELIALDDPDNPLLLKISGPGITAATTTKIDFPEAVGSTLESALAAGDTVEVRSIYFAFASDRIRPQSDRVLREISAVLKKHPDWQLRVDGHTDSIGNDAANLELSKRRAAAIKAVLSKEHGIDATRINTDGYGESSPIETNATPEGRARNRRVELRRV